MRGRPRQSRLIEMSEANIRSTNRTRGYRLLRKRAHVGSSHHSIVRMGRLGIRRKELKYVRAYLALYWQIDDGRRILTNFPPPSPPHIEQNDWYTDWLLGGVIVTKKELVVFFLSSTVPVEL